MNVLIGMLLSIVPHEAVMEVRCERVEVNRVYDGCGKLCFEQLILWDGADCRDWRMTAKSGRPRYCWRTGQWMTRWVENGELIEVKAEVYRESDTQHDPEILEREYWPQERRRRILP